MKIAVDLIEGLRYKLRMMGIPVDGPTNVFCDNEAVVMNSSRPESVLKKKHNAIAYHRVREAQAAKIIRVAKEPGETNLADILTKLMPGPRMKELLERILW
jgi:RPA family protein